MSCKVSTTKSQNIVIASRDVEQFNTLTAGAEYILVFFFYWHIGYHVLNMLKIKCDINQQDLKRVDPHFVKSE